MVWLEAADDADVVSVDDAVAVKVLQFQTARECVLSLRETCLQLWADRVVGE